VSVLDVETLDCSMMFRGAKRQLAKADSSSSLGLDYHVAGGLIGLGTFLGLLGATVVVLKVNSQLLMPHLNLLQACTKVLA